VGRTPNVDGLGLEDVGAATGPKGVVVDERMRTNLPWLYAAGDVAGRWRFTHSAGYEAARAVRNMFLPGSSGGDYLVPWCTFTDPELARAGLTEAQARARHGDDAVRVWRHDLAHSDRARTDSAPEGELRIVTAKGRIVGAHVLAPAAGELIGELALAIERRLKLADLASVVHVYPTIALAIQQLAAQASYAKAERVRWLVRSRA
jgi:pyruvate/2-oxoglutarate dehydrogenase complex dihydrolipoamide dehydrogenase (E3) component